MPSTIDVKRYVPTLAHWLARRAETRRNRLPGHLRPLAVWPIWIQLVLNALIAYTLTHLMLNRDEYFTETGPAFNCTGSAWAALLGADGFTPVILLNRQRQKIGDG